MQTKERGETAACRAALTTSVDGASLPTKPEAPACMAAKIWSSPECMVSTTRPVVLSDLADRPDDVEPGAVRELEVGDDHVGLELVVLRERLDDRAGRADDVMSASRSKTPAEPAADQLVVVDEEDP